MSLHIDGLEPVPATVTSTVAALSRFFLRKLNTELTPVWRTSTGADSVDYVAFTGALPRIGLTGLRTSRVLSDDERSEITRTFQTIVGGLVAMGEKANELRRLEAHQALYLGWEFEGQASNVIPMLKPQYYRDSDAPKKSRDNRWMLRLDCLIESKSHFEILKMAHELHAHSQRNAFVDYKDLDQSVRTYPDEFLRLGGVTVFIPDIFALSRHEQFSLTQVIRHDATHRPLVMVGTHQPFSQLKSESDIQEEFLTLISRAYLKLTKTVAQYKSEGLFHYFLDSLT